MTVVHFDKQQKRKEDRKEYLRKYYREHVDYEMERIRKQEFYEQNKDEILRKAKERYQRKKLEKLGI